MGFFFLDDPVQLKYLKIWVVSRPIEAVYFIKVISGKRGLISAIYLVHSSINVDLVLSGLITSLHPAFAFLKAKDLIIVLFVDGS